ncbi:MAG: hypothetical protein N3D17_02965 [bacterium]|nr:hypothetical protein [bacterium]
MLDKLIKKVIEDAENKALNIIEEAEKEIDERYKAEKESIEKEYEIKIKKYQEEVDREMERKITAFVMEKDKELLAIKNSFIDEVLKNVEDKFNDYLMKNMKDVIVSVCKDIKEKEYVIKVPAGADIKIDGVKIEKDSSLNNTFIIVSDNWDIVFNWDNVKSSIEDNLRERISSLLSQDNGEERTA